MKIHVLQIPPDGKHFEGEESSDILELTEVQQVRAVSPVSYSLEVGLSEGGLWAHGQVSVKVECECVRCLEKFRRPLEAPEFAVQIELEGKETVDLTEYLREDILLALPAHPTCDWDGKKVCKAHFSNAVDEPLAEPRDTWKALDNLQL